MAGLDLARFTAAREAFENAARGANSAEDAVALARDERVAAERKEADAQKVEQESDASLGAAAEELLVASVELIDQYVQDADVRAQLVARVNEVLG